MRLRLVREPFDHPDYIFELKHDGFWAIAYLQHGECKLVSRNQRTLGFDALKRSLAKLPAQTAILDGEIICLDAKGVSQFNQLLNRKWEPSFTRSTFCGLMAIPEADAPYRAKEATRATHTGRNVLTPALCSAHRAAREGLFR